MRACGFSIRNLPLMLFVKKTITGKILWQNSVFLPKMTDLSRSLLNYLQYPSGYSVLVKRIITTCEVYHKYMGTNDMPYMYWWSSTRVMQIFMQASTDMPQGYCRYASQRHWWSSSWVFMICLLSIDDLAHRYWKCWQVLLWSAVCIFIMIVTF